MRQAFHLRFIGLLMAILMLISSTGFVMVEHICQLRGKTQSMWNGKDKCKMHCPALIKEAPVQKGAAQIKKQSCCRENAYFSRLQVCSLNGTSLLVETLASPALVFDVAISPISQTLRSGLGVSIGAHPNPPPYLHSTGQYLALLCLWLI